jgi:hypothetical protein
MPGTVSNAGKTGQIDDVWGGKNYPGIGLNSHPGFVSF